MKGRQRRMERRQARRDRPFVSPMTDVNGSWTGTVPDEPNEVPTQDVDDL